MAATKKTVSEPAGILKLPIDLSMVVAWMTESGLIKHANIIGKVHMPLPNSTNNDLKYVNNRTPRAFLVPIPRSPRQEYNNGDNHGNGANPIAQTSPNFILDVHQHRDSSESPYADEEEEPVEEIRHLCLLLLVFVVELVGPEAGDAGLQAAGAQGYEVEG
nr:Os08g0155550 [Ipomoea trifida]